MSALAVGVDVASVIALPLVDGQLVVDGALQAQQGGSRQGFLRIDCSELPLDRVEHPVGLFLGYP